MKDAISKKMLKEASVLLIAIVMVSSTVVVTANIDDNMTVLVSLTSYDKDDNHMIFDDGKILGNGILLWDNGNPDNRNGLSCCYYPGRWIREVVDDFDINEIIWQVGGGHFKIIIDSGCDAWFIDEINVFFYDDIGNKPSISRYAERIDVKFDAYNTGAHYWGRPEIAIDVVFDMVELVTGKWWVCFQPVLYDNCYWLTASGYGENIWGSLPDAGYPKWTECYPIFRDYYDVSFKLFASSQPPDTPDRPEGPTEGAVGVEYTFSTRTTDPEGDQVYYLWDWGDGTSSEWLGPYDSGATTNASHGWNDAGDYNITVKAKDVNDRESNWSIPLAIHIVDAPILKIGSITGGLFKVNAVIKNTGSVDAISVNWNITLNGGFILLGKETSGMIAGIPAGEEKAIISSLIFGFGKTVITVTAEVPESSDTKEQDAFILLLFIKILDEQSGI